MRILGAFAAALLVGCGHKLAPIAAQSVLTEPSSHASIPASESNTFTFKLIKASVPAKSKHNVLMSPLSVRLALGMLANGAVGETRDRLMKLIDAKGRSIEALNAENQALMQAFMGAKGVELSIANSVWWFRRDPPKEPFVRTMKADYGAEAFALKDKSASSIAKIDEWVKTNTRGRIPEMIQEVKGSLALVDAVAFDGQWLEKFDKARTIDADFHKEGGGTVPVKMMRIDHESAVLSRGGAPDLCVAMLPYEGEEFKALFVLPAEGESATEMLRTMTPARLQGLSRDLQPEANVSLPKCHMEVAYDLEDSLRAMGASQFVDGSNDFSLALSGPATGDDSISQFVHKTFIEWDEEGTRAAAATETEAVTASDSIPIVFDRPFLFFILHAKSGTVLFAGVCHDPSKN